MRTATELLAQYAAYHRDRRNIVSHFIGVPMIVFSIGVLLARPALAAGGIVVTPAWIVFALAAAWYVTRGDAILGVAASAAVAVLLWLGQQVSGGSVPVWLGWGIGFFVVGWLIQFIGHWYEGGSPRSSTTSSASSSRRCSSSPRRCSCSAGTSRCCREIERRAGPTTMRDMARIA